MNALDTTGEPGLAAAAAVAIAREHGLSVDAPVMLRSTNNVVAWLRPSGVVAKIGVGRGSQVARELAVALELVALAGPVVAPSSVPPPVVYRRAGLEITFWTYQAQDDSTEIPAEKTATALHALHRALSRLSMSLQQSLPSFTQELVEVRALLETAVWCFAEAHRGDLAEHAAWHLAEIKAHVAPHLRGER